MDRGEAAAVPRHCPRCRGPLWASYEDELDCLFCGESVFLHPAAVVERPPVVQVGPRRRGRPRKHPLVA